MSEPEIVSLQVNFARMEEKIDAILSEIKDIKACKADKWTESAIKGLMGGVASLLLALVIFLLTK